ncbi:hypothetical protein ElyMa_001877500 [Elysia marginata]|uniref:Uncharacterized protein n=1 Tax=Elysia marginata TaxID=1093978 RepID=A0AAV4EPM7_9GAST|nr:hypothetical protein ElyMa_001877500 [Elysia marginata]
MQMVVVAVDDDDDDDHHHHDDDHDDDHDAWQNVRASVLRSGVCGFDSCHAAIALGKQLTLIFPIPPTCKLGTWLKRVHKICGIVNLGLGGSMAEWLARRTRDLEVAGSIPDHAMFQLAWESNLP